MKNLLFLLIFGVSFSYAGNIRTNKIFTPNEETSVYIYSYSQRKSKSVKYFIYKVNDTKNFLDQHTLNNANAVKWDSLCLASKQIDKGEATFDRYYGGNISLGKLQTGIYVVEAFDGYEVYHTIVYVTPYTLLTAASTKDAVVQVKNENNLTESGFLIRNARHEKPNYVHNKLAYFKGENFDNFFYARRGEQFALSTAYLSYSYNSQVFTGHLFSDRSAYRPKQWVYFHGVFRNKDGSSYAIPKDSVHYTIHNAQYEEVAKKWIKLNKDGAISDSLYLEESFKLGTYKVTFSTTGYSYYWNNSSPQFTFELEEYKKPEFEVLVNSTKSQYQSGSELTANISAKYFFGAPVTQAKVQYKVVREDFYIPWYYFSPWYRWYSAYYENQYRASEVVHSGQLEINEKGEAQVSYSIPEKTPNSRYHIIAEVTDGSRRTITGKATVLSSLTDYSLNARAEKYYYYEDEQPSIKLMAYDLSKNLKEAKLKIELKKYSYNNRIWNHDEVIRDFNFTTSTDPQNNTFELPKLDAGYYYLDITSTDSRGNKVSTNAYFSVYEEGKSYYYNPWRNGSTADLNIESNKDVYEADDNIVLTLNSRIKGDVLLTVNGMEMYHFNTHLMNPLDENTPDFRMISLNLPSDLVGNVNIQLSSLKNGYPIQSQKNITILPNQKMLDVSLEFDAKKYKPGDRAKATVRVKDYLGNPVPNANVALYASDESIYSLYPDKTKKIDEVFYPSGLSFSLRLSHNAFNYYGYGKAITPITIRDRMKKHQLTFSELYNISFAKNEFVNAAHSSNRQNIEGIALDKSGLVPLKNINIKYGSRNYTTDAYGYFSFKATANDSVLTFNSSSNSSHSFIIHGGGKGLSGYFGINKKTGKHESEIHQNITYTIDDLVLAESANEELDATTVMDSEVSGGAVATGFAGAPMAKESAKGDANKDFKSLEGQKQQAEDQNAPAKLRNNFRDILGFQPDLKTNGMGVAQFEFTVPDNLTTWRAQARVYNAQTQVGQAMVKIISTKNLLVRAETPRFITRGDELYLATTVHNYLDSKKKTTVIVEADGLELSSTKRVVEIEPNGEAHIDWTLSAKQVGSAKIRVKALTNEESDAMEVKVPVQPFGLEVMKSDNIYLSQNGSKSIELEIPMNGELASANLEISVAPSISSSLTASLESLIGYPYGCVEQTMSRFLPTVIVANTMTKMGKSLSTNIDQTELDKMVTQGTKRLAELHHNDGGWGWWENDASHPFMTSYVVNGLYIAKEAGYNIPDAMINQGKNAMRNMISNKNEKIDGTTSAYMAMVLAKTGETSSYKKIDIPSKLENAYEVALWAQAAAYAKDHKTQNTMISWLEENVIESGSMAYWGGKKFYYSWQDDQVETTANAIHALLLKDEDHALIPKSVIWLLNKRKGNSWYNTRQTAMSVYALQNLIKKEINPDLEYELAVNGFNIGRFKLDNSDVNKPAHSFQVDGEKLLTAVQNAKTGKDYLKEGKNKIKLSMTGKGSLFLSAKLTYYLDGKNASHLSPGNEDLDIEREYYKLVPKTTKNGLIYEKVAADKMNINSGDNILVKVKVKAKSPQEYVLIEDPIPAGCEFIRDYTGYNVEGENLYQNKGRGYYGWYWNYWYTHRELRDNKIAFTVTRLAAGNEYSYTYLMKAQIPGQYKLNPAVVQLMYYPEFRNYTQFGEFRILE
jgi:uncharacterized protein YfaS (alpha-2-macroglobulin family)